MGKQALKLTSVARRLQKLGWRTEIRQEKYLFAWWNGIAGSSFRLEAGWFQYRIELRHFYASNLHLHWYGRVEKLVDLDGINQTIAQLEGLAKLDFRKTEQYLSALEEIEMVRRKNAHGCTDMPCRICGDHWDAEE